MTGSLQSTSYRPLAHGRILPGTRHSKLGENRLHLFFAKQPGTKNTGPGNDGRQRRAGSQQEEPDRCWRSLQHLQQDVLRLLSGLIQNNNDHLHRPGRDGPASGYQLPGYVRRQAEDADGVRLVNTVMLDQVLCKNQLPGSGRTEQQRHRGKFLLQDGPHLAVTHDGAHETGCSWTPGTRERAVMRSSRWMTACFTWSLWPPT